MNTDKKKTAVETGDCPLLNLPCPQGENVAEECCLRVFGDFDPVRSFVDLSILECARNRAKKMSEGTVKFYY